MSTPVAPAGALPDSPTETWELRVPGKVVLNILKANRFGQPIEDRLVLGPNRRGMRFGISMDDRRDNQRMIADEAHDPFRNGMLLRIDGDQQASEETASTDVLRDDELLDVFDLDFEDFKVRVAALGEVAVRNIRELAEGVGASHAKVRWLEEHITARFQPGGPQRSIRDDSFSERLS